MGTTTMKAMLLTPLFDKQGNFNAGCKRTRFIPIRYTEKYLYFKPASNPENGNVHVVVNSMVVNLRVTEFMLKDKAGFHEFLARNFNGSYSDYLKEIRSHEEKISEYEKEWQSIGEESEVWDRFTDEFLHREKSLFLDSVSNGGKSFPSFIGALSLGRLKECVELRNTYNENQESERKRLEVEQEKEDRAFMEEQLEKIESAVQQAVLQIQTDDCCFVQNEILRVYKTPIEYTEKRLFNFLFEKYRINVPLKTKGWVNEKLSGVEFEHGKTNSLSFKKYKGCKCPDSIWKYLNDLIEKMNQEKGN